MSEFFATLIILVILAIPVLLVILLIRAAMKKPITKIIAVIAMCVASILPLSILGTITSPTTRCEHEYSVVQEVASTCTEQGKVVKVCSLCENESVEYLDIIDHSWKTDSITQVTCTSEGYRIDRCVMCSATKKIDGEAALGHSMKEVSRIDATYETDGKVVTKCDRCGHEESETLEKLVLETIKFDGLELTFGLYSFTEVDNKYSEYYGKPVVKIPVTIKNISSDPHGLNRFNYSLFGVSGVESSDISYYFSDDVSEVGELLPNASVTACFHILYDGDGVYTIAFDNWFYDEKTVQIVVTK